MEQTDKKIEEEKTQKSLSSNPIENIVNRIEGSLPKSPANHNNPYSAEGTTPVQNPNPVKKNPFGENQSFSSIVETINNFNIGKSKSHPFVPYP